jgi:hypothetical protein
MSGPLYHVPIPYGLATADNTRVHGQAESRQAEQQFQVCVFMKKMCAIGKFHRVRTRKGGKKYFSQCVVKPMKEYQMHLIWLTWYNA